MKKTSSFLAFLSVILVSNVALATGIPVYSYAEMVTQRVDEAKSDVGSKLIETQKKMVDSVLDVVGGPETFSASSLQAELNKALVEPSEIITGYYEGLQNLLGKDSEYGQIAIKKCGGNADEVIQRIKETIVVPAKLSDRLKKTQAELDKMSKERMYSIQQAATSGLAKAWIAQSDTSDIAEAISKTQEELNNADSQMDVFGTLVRLQEETQKNLNSRFSLVADDVMASGLFVLETNK